MCVCVCVREKKREKDIKKSESVCDFVRKTVSEREREENKQI